MAKDKSYELLDEKNMILEEVPNGAKDAEIIRLLFKNII